MSTIAKITDLKKQIEDLEKMSTIKEYPICVLNQISTTVWFGNEFCDNVPIKPCESTTVVAIFDEKSKNVKFNIIIPNIDNVINITITLLKELFTSLNSVIIHKDYILFNDFALGAFSDQIYYIENKFDLTILNKLYRSMHFHLLSQPTTYPNINPMGFKIKSNISLNVIDRITKFNLGSTGVSRKFYHTYLSLSNSCFVKIDIDLCSDIEIICKDNDILINGKSILHADTYKISVDKSDTICFHSKYD